jgi:hypothetical protein
MAFTRFKGGKLAPQRRMSMPALGDFLAAASAWPSVPAAGWEAKVPIGAWGMLGNDQYGDCAEAGILHLIQAQAANTGNPVTSTTAQALALYSAVTGFDPNDPDTDQGTVLADLLTYIQANGVEMTDSTGKTVTIEVVGSASLDISSVAQMRYAGYTFGGNYLGINCPQQCESDLTNWNFGPGLTIAGGHCISQPGEGAGGGQIISWGQQIPASTEFLLSYLDEAYCVITKAWLNAQEKTPTGLDLNGLLAAMKAL